MRAVSFPEGLAEVLWSGLARLSQRTPAAPRQVLGSRCRHTRTALSGRAEPACRHPCARGPGPGRCCFRPQAAGSVLGGGSWGPGAQGHLVRPLGSSISGRLGLQPARCPRRPRLRVGQGPMEVRGAGAHPPPALWALACGQAVLAPEAWVGGPGSPPGEDVGRCPGEGPRPAGRAVGGSCPVSVSPVFARERVSVLARNLL